jgi:hypothetical protein
MVLRLRFELVWSVHMVSWHRDLAFSPVHVAAAVS